MRIEAFVYGSVSCYSHKHPEELFLLDLMVFLPLKNKKQNKTEVHVHSVFKLFLRKLI